MSTLNAKTLVLAAVAAMVMGIVGCGGDGKTTETPPAATGEATAAPTAEPTAAPTAEPTAAPAQ
jgi:hypothetical protein